MSKNAIQMPVKFFSAEKVTKFSKNFQMSHFVSGIFACFWKLSGIFKIWKSLVAFLEEKKLTGIFEFLGKFSSIF